VIAGSHSDFKKLGPGGSGFREFAGHS
jgi:hypothetical protein